MSDFVPENLFFFLHYFNIKKPTAESYCILVKVYGEHDRTQDELAESLRVNQAVISKRFKETGYIQKQENWLRYELS